MSRLELECTAFGADQPMPRKFTADGINVSPPLYWRNLPSGTQELALIVDDPDAPQAEPWVHWLLYKLAPGIARVPEGVPPSQRVPDPAGALQGKNSWGRIGYGGPQPPRGHGVHHYHFRLYVLDRPLELPPGLDKPALLKAMEGHVIGEAEWIGTYER